LNEANQDGFREWLSVPWGLHTPLCRGSHHISKEYTMAADMFLKFAPEIKGESSQQGYEGQIEVLDFRFGVVQPGGFDFAKGGAKVQARLDDLSVTFRTCSASPTLMQYCSSGKHLDKATLSFVKAAGDKAAKYMEINLTNVVVSSYRTGRGGSDEIPQETITLNFAKIEHEYFATDNKGVATSAGKGSWDQQTSTK
jgi:type VI secretion system secreted protein Hcp